VLALDSLSSRDRLAFSKSILRRFIRDCVDRDAAVASPWTVKLPVAARYGVDSAMPEETRQGVEDIKRGEIQKRKKVWEDKEGPLKKQKKLSAAREEKGDDPSHSIATGHPSYYINSSCTGEGTRGREASQSRGRATSSGKEEEKAYPVSNRRFGCHAVREGKKSRNESSKTNSKSLCATVQRQRGVF
jgi:hypothetical protein